MAVSHIPIQKPADLAEKSLLDAILDNTFPVGSPLPPERELANQLGVTRPTLREALQRLSRDGWIHIQQGKSTIVNDYWREGNLIMLNALAKDFEKLSPHFITNLLEVRAALAPAYTRAAFLKASAELVEYLEPLTQLPETAEAYSRADQDLHHHLTVLSGNPIFSLIYNGFRQISYQAGLIYFHSKAARDFSKAFYLGLLEDAKNTDYKRAEKRTADVTSASLTYWLNSIKNQEE